MVAIFLVAGRSERFEGIVEHKSLLTLCGQTLLERLMVQAANLGATTFVFGVGAKADYIMAEVLGACKCQELPCNHLAFVRNVDYATTGNLHTLWLCKEYLGKPTVLFEGDVVFGALPVFDPVVSRWLVADGYFGRGCYIPGGTVGQYTISDTVPVGWKKSAGVYYLTAHTSKELQWCLEQQPLREVPVDSLLATAGLLTLQVEAEGWHEMDDVGDFGVAKGKITRSVEYVPDPVVI